MLFPVYVHTGDDEHAHGAEVPDFPGCYSAADNWDDLPGKIQEAVELYCEDEDLVLPAPSSLGELMQCEDYRGGIWVSANKPTHLP